MWLRTMRSVCAPRERVAAVGEVAFAPRGRSVQVVPFGVATQVHGHVAANGHHLEVLGASPRKRLLHQCCSDASSLQGAGHAGVRDVHAARAELVIEFAAQALDHGVEAPLIGVMLDVEVGDA